MGRNGYVPEEHRQESLWSKYQALSSWETELTYLLVTYKGFLGYKRAVTSSTIILLLKVDGASVRFILKDKETSTVATKNMAEVANSSISWRRFLRLTSIWAQIQNNTRCAPIFFLSSPSAGNKLVTNRREGIPPISFGPIVSVEQCMLLTESSHQSCCLRPRQDHGDFKKSTRGHVNISGPLSPWWKSKARKSRLFIWPWGRLISTSAWTPAWINQRWTLGKT